MKEKIVSIKNFIDDREQYMVIDVRIEEQYEENHIDRPLQKSFLNNKKYD